MTWTYECPNCEEDIQGGAFGDDAYCERCDKLFETDWDYVDYGTITWWIVKEIDKDD